MDTLRILCVASVFSIACGEDLQYVRAGGSEGTTRMHQLARYINEVARPGWKVLLTFAILSSSLSLASSHPSPFELTDIS